MARWGGRPCQSGPDHEAIQAPGNSAGSTGRSGSRDEVDARTLREIPGQDALRPHQPVACKTKYPSAGQGKEIRRSLWGWSTDAAKNRVTAIEGRYLPQLAIAEGARSHGRLLGDGESNLFRARRQAGGGAVIVATSHGARPMIPGRDVLPSDGISFATHAHIVGKIEFDVSIGH